MTNLSHQIEAAIAALDANPNPTPEQLAVIRETHRAFLCQLYDFAIDVEENQLGYTGRINVLAGVGIVRRAYHWLTVGRRRPDARQGIRARRLVVVS